jgi:hypothetical protein
MAKPTQLVHNRHLLVMTRTKMVSLASGSQNWLAYTGTDILQVTLIFLSVDTQANSSNSSRQASTSRGDSGRSLPGMSPITSKYNHPRCPKSTVEACSKMTSTILDMGGERKQGPLTMTMLEEMGKPHLLFG